MLLSICIPCHKRIGDLLVSLPSVIIAANNSPPVEIVVLDYGNPLLLQPQLHDMPQLHPENRLVVPVYRKRDHYHNTHARNLSVKRASGEFIIISSTDLVPAAGFFSYVRSCLADSKASWLHEPISRSKTITYGGSAMPGVIVCRKSEFVAAGGYDERMEFYGGEDKELNARLLRRGVSDATYSAWPHEMSIIRTRDPERTRNYRLPLSKMEMLTHNNSIRRANDEAGLLVANEGVEWGAE